MTKFYSKAQLGKDKKKWPFPENLRLKDHVRETRRDGQIVHEFIGTDTFGSEWYERTQYEVNAGREQEPTLYEPLYDIIEDSSLPRTLNVKRIGPGGVVLEEIEEGGEVTFASVKSSEFAVTMKHYGVGLEYSKDLVIFNELWNVPIVERQVGIAYNALLNHIHLNPILAAAYAAANQTAANTSGSTTVEDFMLTIEDAIANSRADTTNPRRGPYALLINSAQEIIVQKALTREVQQGLATQSRVLDSIQSVISYDGWSGTRGLKTTTYGGVTSGTGYLVSLQYRDQDFQSYVKQGLDSVMGNADISRFILEQIVWDTYFTNYSNPTASVEEVTFPS
jgi:hypothetical protein